MSNYNIKEKLVLAQVASCNCDTKTNDHDQHKELCPYRVMNEALGTIILKDKRIDELMKTVTGMTTNA